MYPSVQKDTDSVLPHREGVCPLEELINVIGGKWKVIILWHVLSGPHRFGELRRQMPGVTQKMLTQQLRELEQHGFVTRTVFAEVPPRVVYAATPMAEEIRTLLHAMHDWARDHLPACAPKPPVGKPRRAKQDARSK